jgi:hypothetical protein
VDPALRALVRSHEYEDWPRGRIVFDRSRDLFILYADRKLLAPAMSARIATQFHLPTSEHRDAERARVMMRATRIVDRAHETGDVEPRGDQYWPTASFRGEADAARAAGVAGQNVCFPKPTCCACEIADGRHLLALANRAGGSRAQPRAEFLP